MTSIFIPSFRAEGIAAAPASKSDLHRLLILAFLRGKPTEVCNLNLCDDVQATIDCLRALGANIEITANTALVSPLGFPSGEAVERSETDEGPADKPQKQNATSSAASTAAPSPEGKARSCSSSVGCADSFPSERGSQEETASSHVDEKHVPLLDARESGSTLRFLLPVACALYPHVRFTARGSLLTRPIGGIVACLKHHGVSFSSDTLPFETRGLLRPGTYQIDASLSSQYVSGLLMASVITGGTVEITGNAASAPYIELTRRRIADYETDEAVFTAEGDWSAAAALLCLPGKVTVSGLDPDSPQADKAILDALGKSGAEISWNRDRVTVRNNEPKPFDFDITDCPDLAPCLAVLMAAGKAETADVTETAGASPRPTACGVTAELPDAPRPAACSITGCGRLIYKESNRAEAIVNMINTMGGTASFDGETMVIRGPLSGGKVGTCSDHRIAMAGCVAAAWSRNGAEIDDADCVQKSCPEFWKLIDSLRK